MAEPLTQKQEARKRELLDAALLVFSQKGYHQAQISDIIEKADVARGTFYLYFEGKREIFATILEEIIHDVRAEIESLPTDAATRIPDAMKGNLKRLTNLFVKKPNYARVLLCESVTFDAESDEKLTAFYHHLIAYIEKALKQGQEMGFVRDGSTNMLAIFILGTLKELFFEMILGNTKFKVDDAVEALYQSITRLVAKPEILTYLSQEGLL
ncbi:TetR/AcrR family transcriptional regulator [bacterium]|nr:TetR/AcrR family transcriptional regulator [bacterium]